MLFLLRLTSKDDFASLSRLYFSASAVLERESEERDHFLMLLSRNRDKIGLGGETLPYLG